MTTNQALFLIAGILLSSAIYSQPSAAIKQPDAERSDSTVSLRYLTTISSRTFKLETRIEKRSAKALRRFAKQEIRLKRKLARTNQAKADSIFGDINQAYSNLDEKIAKAGGQSYIPSLDTISTSLNFLQQNQQWLPSSKESVEKLNIAMANVKQVNEKFKKAETIKKYLKERKEFLRQQLANTNIAKDLKKINKEAYYYSEHIKAYKDLVKDHKKAEKKAIELLSKTKAFKNFMRRNSQLASLFRLPADPDDPSSALNLTGLQTRSQVNGLIQQQIASGGPNAQQQFRENVQAAQNQLDQIRNKILKTGRSKSDLSDGGDFRPNNQKTKTFLQRLEFGTNIQSQKANGFFPVTSDIALSVGYKLNDKSIIGVGASYKLGWGKDIRHISISHQGVGIRSFADWKIKGSFWLTGGYEMNYRAAFNNLDVLKNMNAWQQSGLIGLSKIISLKTKFFKHTRLQLLWDLLSYQQLPRTQPLLFRVGYNF